MTISLYDAHISLNHHEFRGMATVICNYAVFIAWTILFGTSKISVADCWSFQKIMAIVICLGIVSSVLFHYIVEEKPRRELNQLFERDYFAQPMRVKDWFSEPQFYQVAGVYLRPEHRNVCSSVPNLPSSLSSLYIETKKLLVTRYSPCNVLIRLSVLNGHEASEQDRRKKSHLLDCSISGFTVINEMGICYVFSGKFFKGNKFSCDDRKVKSHFAQTIWIC